MAKYEVHQPYLTRAQRDQINAGGLKEVYAAYLDARVNCKPDRALRCLLYKHVSNIEAEDLEDVFEVGNIGPEHQIERLEPMCSVSVGDIIRDPEGRTFIVASFGFEQLGGGV